MFEQYHDEFYINTAFPQSLKSPNEQWHRSGLYFPGRRDHPNYEYGQEDKRPDSHIIMHKKLFETLCATSSEFAQYLQKRVVQNAIVKTFNYPMDVNDFGMIEYGRHRALKRFKNGICLLDVTSDDVDNGRIFEYILHHCTISESSDFVVLDTSCSLNMMGKPLYMYGPPPPSNYKKKQCDLYCEKNIIPLVSPVKDHVYLSRYDMSRPERHDLYLLPDNPADKFVFETLVFERFLHFVIISEALYKVMLPFLNPLMFKITKL